MLPKYDTSHLLVSVKNNNKIVFLNNWRFYKFCEYKILEVLERHFRNALRCKEPYMASEQ